MSFRLSTFARALTAVVTLFAWLVATNHCAFGLMGTGTCAAHAHCAGGKTLPAKGTAPECCKALRGLPAQPRLAAPVSDDALSVPTLALFHEPALAPMPRVSFAISGHGPPFAVSFAESVLQRSLLSHAPPRPV